MVICWAEYENTACDVPLRTLDATDTANGLAGGPRHRQRPGSLTMSDREKPTRGIYEGFWTTPTWGSRTKLI